MLSFIQKPFLWWKAGREQRSFKARVKRYKSALKLVAPFDGMVVSKSVYHQALALLGVYASLVEKAGSIHNPLRKAMLRDLTIITQGLVDSAHLGDPAIQLPEIRETYVRARQRSMSRKARQRGLLNAAVQHLTQQGQAPSARDVRVMRRNIRKQSG
jgi:hypothetical protein